MSNKESSPVLIKTIPEEDFREKSPFYISMAPIHLDKTTLKTYFSEIILKPPPISNYVIHSCTPESEWKVKLGDIVVIHSECGAGRTVFGIDSAGNIGNHYHYPFRVGWSIAEVIAIWKEHKEETGFAHMLNSTTTLSIKGGKYHNVFGDIHLEIRWFWRRSELPGNSNSNAVSQLSSKTKVTAPTTFEEIFETDHVDECTASSLLGPVKIIPNLEEGGVVKTEFHCGIPLITCVNSRLWSFHRRSIIPAASDDSRIARSRMYSLSCIRDEQLKKAIVSATTTKSAEERKLQLKKQQTKSITRVLLKDSFSWREAFKNAIKKLTLTQASSDAHFDYAALVGRKNEQSEILSFLRSAIRGAHKLNPVGSVSPSMFVSGPPGTGKTVSIHSAVNKLRQEQVSGLLPDFDFFSLNGMEMRHPFESYVKFWEKISGHAKDRLSPEAAASKLDRYFSESVDCVTNILKKRKVIVLMLDEIDYLVTKKQTVLYNFFDWPKRTFQTQDYCPRLIVIGISNTVNLPSQMKASVRSRLGSTRCDFKAYNAQNIVDILTSKIQPDPSFYPVFHKDAILFASRKVAAITGDIRKAFQTCRAATELVFQQTDKGIRENNVIKSGFCEKKPTVTIKDIQIISREKSGSVMVNAISSSTPFEALVLVSLGTLLKYSGHQIGYFDIIEVMTKTEAVANAYGNFEYLPPPAFHEMLEVLTRLAEARLIRLHTEKSTSNTFRCSIGGSGGAWPVVTLDVDECDIISALSKSPHSQLAEKQLSGPLF